MNEQTTTKAGWKTTEFYLESLAMVLGILMSSGVMDNAEPGSIWVRIVGGLIACVSAFGYSVDRRKVKTVGQAAQTAGYLQELQPLQTTQSTATGSGNTDG